MVTVTSNSEVGVSKTFLRENGEWLLAVAVGARWKKIYFSTEKPTIYHKSLGGVSEILL